MPPPQVPSLQNVTFEIVNNHNLHQPAAVQPALLHQPNFTMQLIQQHTAEHLARARHAQQQQQAAEEQHMMMMQQAAQQAAAQQAHLIRRAPTAASNGGAENDIGLQARVPVRFE